ncbi:sugar ABC transporter ATP-binding protein [Glaciimonas sp. GG7]
MSAATETHAIVLRVEDVTKVYPGTIALKNASFAVRQGAVNVLVGENGAGKSTLMKIIAGVEQPTIGRVMIGDTEVHLNSIDDAVAHGIGIVFQELNLFPNLSIAENIFISREITGRACHINTAEQERLATELMVRLEHPINPATLVGELRIGQQQIVEIAKALSKNARILIMDEPTSALSATEVDILFRVIAELKSQGVAIVYISHRLEELIRIGDYITVLRDGRITGSQSMKNVDVKWIVRQMVGADTRDFSRATDHTLGPEILSIKNVCLRGKTQGYLVDHVSLTLRVGEIVGIYGLMGAGRSELFECIFGLHAHAQGEIALNGQALAGKTVAQRIGHGMALIPEDRKAEGLVSGLSISSNLTLSSLHDFATGFHIRAEREQGAIRSFIQQLAIKVANPALEVSSLSGGNQQKVVIGRALMTNPKVLLMDEPSRGIDVGAKADVFKVMRDLAFKGLGILFVTSDLDEVMALSDRIIVMSNGRVTAEFECEAATRDALVKASAMGHNTIEETSAS